MLNMEKLLAKSNGSFEKLMEDNLLDSNEVSSSKKLAMLEMKCVNESQKAEHSTRMYEHQKKVLRDLEDRNTQLEEKFSKVPCVLLPPLLMIG